MIVPPEFTEFFRHFALYFTVPTHRRFVLLALGAILTSGRRTVANIIRTLGPLAPGDLSDYQRVLNRAPWPILQLGCVLTRLIITQWPSDDPLVLVGDDTVCGHPGKKVHGPGSRYAQQRGREPGEEIRHRDPVRSTHTHTVWKYGHRWVVLAILVRLPGTTRAWALPILADLYRSKQDRGTRLRVARGRRHRTPAQLMARLLRLMLIRLPGHRLVFVGDSTFVTHELARFCQRHARQLSLVSKLHPNANLHQPPPPYSGKGRPQVKGLALRGTRWRVTKRGCRSVPAEAAHGGLVWRR